MVLLLALMSLLGATLTLPGIAGIVLTMGMAVDANVLIFSRIREEIAAGMTVQRNQRRLRPGITAILDSNLTTCWSAGFFAMGTGPVKGFAVTMSLGIFTSMFTAIMVTRAMVNLIFADVTSRSCGFKGCHVTYNQLHGRSQLCVRRHSVPQCAGHFQRSTRA
jgi:preprotein translocase subunit SecD